MDGFEDGVLILVGRQVLGGLKHIPFGAESSEPGRHVRRHLLQQRADQRLHIHAEEPPLHFQPRGAGEFPGLVEQVSGGAAPGARFLGFNNSALEIACGCVIPQEAAMQLFQCHYRERGLMSGLYFDYIKDILHAASQGTSGLPCKPPPCLNQHPSPGDCSFAFLF